MNLLQPLSKLSAVIFSPKTNAASLPSISAISNLYRVDATFITLEDLPHSTITAISFELKKTHERIGQILAGNQNLA
jgi:hypothetical protein